MPSRRLRVAFAAAASRVLAAGAGAFALNGVAAALSYGGGAPVPPPPPPPPPGSTLANVILLTPGAGSYPVTIGHTFKPGDMPAEIVAAGWQMDTKNKWPDGSIKFALLSKIVTAAGTSTTLPIGPGIPTLADDIPVSAVQASGLTATIDAGVLGSASWAGADWGAPFLVWAQGHTCLNVIYRKPVGSDTHLTAWLDVRLYSSGDIEVVPFVENGYLLQASPGPKSGTFTFTLNGSTRFGPTALTAGHHTRQPLLSGATLSYWAGTDKTSTPKHDAAYMAGTGYVSAYLPDMARATELPALPNADAGVSVAFEPWEQITTSISNFPTVMGAGGGHKSIAIQPCWEALALTTSTALAHQQMVRESYRFGRYPIHFREESASSAVQHRPFLFSEHLTLSVDNSAIHGITDARGGGAVSVPTPTGSAPHESARWTPSHQPASPLLAYITTGRFWFMEECQFIVGANWLANFPGRQGASDICEPFEIGGSSVPELRKSAWSLRNLAIAALVSPDDADAKNQLLRAQFQAAIDANVTNFHTKYVASPANPFGLIETGSRSFTTGTGTGMLAGGAQTWQYDFWTSVWGRIVAWRLSAARDTRKKASDFFGWVANSIVGRLGTTAATEWLYRDLSVGFDQYAFPSQPPARLAWIWPGKNISTSHSFSLLGGTGLDTTTGTYPDYAGGTGPWWDSWGQMYDHMIVGQSGIAKVDGDLRGSFVDEVDGQFWNAFPAMTAAASLGVAGAAAGIARVRGNALWSFLRGLVVGKYPTYSVDTVTLPLENFTSLDQAAGTRINAGLNDAYAVDFERASGWHPGNILARWWLSTGSVSDGNVFQDAVQAYSGSTWAPEYGTAGALIVNGGSDGASVAQAAYVFDFDSMCWFSVGAPRNLPPDGYWCNTYPAGSGGNVWELQPASGPRTAPQTDLRDTVWFDYTWRGSKIKFANHTVLQNTYVPESLGGGRNGSLWMPYSSYSYDRGFPDPRTGTLRTWTPHVMNLHTGVGRRAIAAPANGVTTGDGYDQPIGRRIGIRAGSRLWYFTQGSANAIYHDLTSAGPPYATASYTIPKVSGGNADYTVVYCSAWVHVPEANALVGIYPTNSNDIQAAVPPSGQVGVQVYTINGSGLLVDQERANFQTRLPISTYAFPKGGVFAGVTWVPASVAGGVGKFYIYEGYGDTFAYTLTPSSLDFASCTFTWGRESFTNGHTGADPVFKAAYSVSDVTRSGVQGKWQYVPALGRIAWHDGPNTIGVGVDGVTRRGVVQLWKPPGTPI